MSRKDKAKIQYQGIFSLSHQITKIHLKNSNN
jgi:hypothetical protein